MVRWRYIAFFLIAVIFTVSLYKISSAKTRDISRAKPQEVGWHDETSPELMTMECPGRISMEMMRQHAENFTTKMDFFAWVKGEKYTNETLATLAYRQNLFLWRAFVKSRKEPMPPYLGPEACNDWMVFRETNRFALRSEYVRSHGGPRWRKECQMKNRSSAANARARGGSVCPHTNKFEGFPRVMVPNELTGQGQFDPFSSPVAEGGLGWVKAYKSCAVVGSSPRMIGSKFGNDIDAHDLVIRFNTATVEGIEEDVGSRTDLRLCGKNRIFYEDCNEIVVNVANPKYNMPNEVSWVLPMEPVFYLPKSVACGKKGEVMKGLKRRKLGWSAGHRGVCYALDLCEHIDIYGFGVPNRRGRFPGAYHITSPYDVCGKGGKGACRRTLHPWMAEYRARSRLNKSNRVCLPDASPS